MTIQSEHDDGPEFHKSDAQRSDLELNLLACDLFASGGTVSTRCSKTLDLASD